MKLLLRFFFQGLLVLLPAVLTFYLFWLIVGTLNDLMFSLIGEHLVQLFELELPTWLTSIMGLLMVLGLITVTGMLASMYLGRFLLGRIDRLLQRIPLVRLLYTSLSDLFKALLGDNRGFDRPVLVQLTPDPGLRVAGFITRDDLSMFGLKDDIAVYLPQSYNFAGNLVIVPRERVTPIEAKASQVTTFIVSGGVSTSNRAED
ncbi:Cytochrome c-type biogenesis protein DsbD, protein-disulfide reductase [Marinobacterium lacunae]|uniref:Cytochrome c-type biogenesis protein DsbD, protein-disulfide reductase n=1 Tax=Marinobacterium lacunae TaxID=1232683 RepID=A0A081FVK4_9GAMM|nr:DUF502 domain-containing protein [Marinobacterium lacunae]KEA62559.1 Cytochrome c-type biogenesis protein DsbD, protein-disulfide reductase [Marinobacterium lacunae]MBR9884035.1 DUF502 domain-containing protein [Oceanospirillales bacterium]